MDVKTASNSHKILGAIWTAWSLLRFFPNIETEALDWTKFCAHNQLVNHNFLTGAASGSQALSTDMGDSTCPRLQGLLQKLRHWPGWKACRRFVPEVDAWLQQGCSKPSAYGMLYCQQHNHLMESNDAHTDEVEKILPSLQRAKALQFKVQRFCEERNAPTFNWTRLMSNDRLRDLMNWDARHKRDLPKGKESSEPHHVLAEDNLDDGDGASGKSRHGYRRGKKWQRRRLGGITATVSGCRLLLDLNEHQFGEGISQVYVALAGVAAFIQDGMAVSTWVTCPVSCTWVARARWNHATKKTEPLAPAMDRNHFRYHEHGARTHGHLLAPAV